MTPTHFFTAAAAGLLLSGCASTLNPQTAQTQAINLVTAPQGATCTLSNDQGRWEVTTPDTATVIKTNWPGLLGNRLQVSCTKGALKGADSFASLPRGLGWMSAASGGIATAIDRQNGFAYPDTISIILTTGN